MYDLAADSAWVSVGVDHDASVFAVTTIAKWWDQMGRHKYPNRRRLLFTADGGGSNGHRPWLWKYELARLAKATGPHILVSTTPPGTSELAARAFALDGQRSACLAELEAADRAVSAATARRERPSFVYFYGPGQFAYTQSLCLLQLDDDGQAAQAARSSLELLDGSFVRNVAFSTLALADAHVRARDVDRAAQVLGDAGELVARNRSARLTQRLRVGRSQLAQCGSVKAVRTLDDRLAAYGLA